MACTLTPRTTDPSSILQARPSSVHCFTYLSRSDVAATGALEPPRVRRTIERSFETLTDARAVCPPKTMIALGDGALPVEETGRVMAMPAYLRDDPPVVGVKWIASVPANTVDAGIPRAHGLVILADPRTGVPLAIMDGTDVSAARTGAVSGLALSRLASKDARTLCLIGAGGIAAAQLAGVVDAVPGLEDIRVFDVRRTRAERLAAEWSDRGRRAVATGTAEEAVRGAQIVIACTVAVGPSFSADWIERGTTVVLVSRLDAPEALHDRTDLLVVDSWAHETVHEGRYVARLLAAGKVRGAQAVVEIGDLLTGRHPGRTDGQQIIVVSHVGLGVHDLAVSRDAFLLAREQHLGVELDNGIATVKDPCRTTHTY
jgi:ornithine cyclodeaminase/alanine dehydrogenase-like protein (mu-crystallin family)